MDYRIINELDNLDVSETEQLLSSINASEFNVEIDKDTANRIKSSVLHKAGISEAKCKKALIPKKSRILLIALILSIIEILFFTSAAFVAWMDGFLGDSGINLSFGGIVPTVFYIFMLSVLSLCVYKVMFYADSEKINIAKIVPTNKTTLSYAAYFVLSWASKIFIFVLFCRLFEKIINHSFFYRFEISSILLVLILLIAVFSVVDMIIVKLKNLLILRFDDNYKFKYKWKLSMKAFWIEILKYIGIIGYLILIIGFSVERVYGNGFVSILNGFVLFFAFNIFMTVIVQLEKRCCLQVDLKAETALSENKIEKSEVETVNKRMLLKRRAFILGLSAAASIYLLCLLVPYVVYPRLIHQKPFLETFSNNNEVDDFFERRKLPFIPERLYSDVSNVTESLFMFNKLAVGAIINKLDLDFLFADLTRNYIAQAVNSMDGNLYGGIEDVAAGTLTKSSDDYSTTNTQVEMVDEADVIKTDGDYVYYLNDSKLFILRAYPPEQMKTVYKYDFLQENLYPLELFLYKDHVAVVLTDDYIDYQLEKWYKENTSSTFVRIYNISDPTNPILERSLKFDYPYLTSRLIENHLYIITTAYIDYGQSKPGYTDSTLGESRREINYKDLFLMRGKFSDNFRKINVVAALPIDNPNGEAQVKAYIGGGGETVYVSTEHIYIVETNLSTFIQAPMEDFFHCLVDDDFDGFNFLNYGTSIYRIKIENGNIGDFDSAFVPGMVHNQFSMDEYDGYFRITTQKGKWQYASSNVYVLDAHMNVCGSLEGLAPGESIYASRFMGDRLYLVTFKTVDPLFVISLKDPKKPKVLGELKIPGYSEYLHPLDENHIIGFGKDTAGGNENFSFYQGIKMAIFDVSDVNNPKEKFVEIIGDRGTESELLRNHKALMYMKNLELMAFPVTLYEKNEKSSAGAYGTFSYQGAYVYNVNSNDGFKLRGRITHLDYFEENEYYGGYINENKSFINRIIYANDSLYTFSGDKVKATRYSDMKEISEIELE